jgi:predicted AAA+ superfamily ATPase
MKTFYDIFSFKVKSLDQIRTLLVEQREELAKFDLGVEREKLAQVAEYKNTPFQVIISGLRRAGKSTLLAQLAHKFYPEGDYFYVNFEDERFLDFVVSDFSKLHELLIELFGNHKTFLLDEIQNVEGWERFINRMIKASYKFYITGSNASLLSKELGTKLTGRHLPVELFPFSFEEFLKFNKVERPDFDRLTTVDRGEIKNLLSDYLRKGGMPQSLQYPKLPMHKILYDAILDRDIGARYKLSDTKPLRELSFYLLSNISSLISYNKIKELLQLGSVNTVSSYINYLEQSWLLFVINRYAYSVKKQQIANKKVYCIDTGLTKSVAFSFSEDRGRFLENIVFLKLRKLCGKDVYYYKTEKDREVDFYLSKQKTFIQVTQSLLDPATRERETKALVEALEEVGKNQGFILTEDEKDILQLEGKTIKVLPIYEWLLV